MPDAKIVPREPTPEMVAKAHLSITDDLDPTSDEIMAIWRAMYDAAQAEPRKCIACPDPTPGRCDACPEDDPDRAAEVASIIADAIVATTPAAPSPAAQAEPRLQDMPGPLALAEAFDAGKRAARAEALAEPQDSATHWPQLPTIADYMAAAKQEAQGNEFAPAAPEGDLDAQVWQAIGQYSASICRPDAELAPPQYLLDAIAALRARAERAEEMEQFRNDQALRLTNRAERAEVTLRAVRGLYQVTHIHAAIDVQYPAIDRARSQGGNDRGDVHTCSPQAPEGDLDELIGRLRGITSSWPVRVEIMHIATRAADAIAALRARAERYDWLRELTLDEWRELLKDVECREEDEIYPDASAGYTPTVRRHWSVYFDAAADAAIDRARTQEPK